MTATSACISSLGSVVSLDDSGPVSFHCCGNLYYCYVVHVYILHVQAKILLTGLRPSPTSRAVLGSGCAGSGRAG